MAPHPPFAKLYWTMEEPNNTNCGRDGPTIWTDWSNTWMLLAWKDSLLLILFSKTIDAATFLFNSLLLSTTNEDQAWQGDLEWNQGCVYIYLLIVTGYSNRHTANIHYEALWIIIIIIMLGYWGWLGTKYHWWRSHQLTHWIVCKYITGMRCFELAREFQPSDRQMDGGRIAKCNKWKGGGS